MAKINNKGAVLPWNAPNFSRDMVKKLKAYNQSKILSHYIKIDKVPASLLISNKKCLEKLIQTQVPFAKNQEVQEELMKIAKSSTYSLINLLQKYWELESNKLGSKMENNIKKLTNEEKITKKTLEKDYKIVRASKLTKAERMGILIEKKHMNNGLNPTKNLHMVDNVNKTDPITTKVKKSGQMVAKLTKTLQDNEGMHCTTKQKYLPPSVNKTSKLNTVRSDITPHNNMDSTPIINYRSGSKTQNTDIDHTLSTGENTCGKLLSKFTIPRLIRKESCNTTIPSMNKVRYGQTNVRSGKRPLNLAETQEIGNTNKKIRLESVQTGVSDTNILNMNTPIVDESWPSSQQTISDAELLNIDHVSAESSFTDTASINKSEIRSIAQQAIKTTPKSQNTTLTKLKNRRLNKTPLHVGNTTKNTTSLIDPEILKQLYNELKGYQEKDKDNNK